MKIIVVINRTAGGIRGDSETHLRQVLGSVGRIDLQIEDFDRRGAGRQLRDLASRSPDFLVVWGGDGTHRSALNAVGRTPSNLVLLPGGTRNLLARSLHGARAWDRVLPAILAASRQRLLPAGRIGDELFFCAVLAGAPALFAGARERLREGDLGKAVGEVGLALHAAGNMHLLVRYGAISGAEAVRLRPTGMIGALVGFLAGNRRMELVTLDDPSIFPALDVVWSSFRSGFRGLRGVSIIPSEALTIENEAGDDIPAIADGEPLSVGGRFEVKFVEQGAYCLTAG